MTNANEFTYPEKIRLSPEQVKELSEKIQKKFLGKTVEVPQTDIMPIITNFTFCLNCQQKQVLGDTKFCSADCMQIHQADERQTIETEKAETICKIIAFVLFATVSIVCGFILYRGLFAAIHLD
jgi:hypothetical protein